jgi:cytoskeleton protein RodZ
MIAIGTSLREARQRRGFEYAQIAAATRIQTKHLRALEAERFDELPGRVYARAFLLEYAEFLGLDSDQFVDEFDTRFPVLEPQEIVPVPPPRPLGFPPHTGAAVAAVAAVAVLGVLGWKLEQTTSAPPVAPHTPAAQTAAVPPPTPKHRRIRTPPVFALIATRGPCWIEAHADSRAGRLLYRGTLEPTHQLRFRAHRLWLRIGAPWNLEAQRDGKRIDLPGRVANLVVTRAAVRVEFA